MEKDKNKTTNSYKLRFNTEKDKEIYKKLKKIKKESGISINGKIGAAKQYISDIDIELMNSSWGGVREGAGRKSTGRKKKNYYVTDEEDQKIRELIEQLRKPRE